MSCSWRMYYMPARAGGFVYTVGDPVLFGPPVMHRWPEPGGEDCCVHRPSCQRAPCGEWVRHDEDDLTRAPDLVTCPKCRRLAAGLQQSRAGLDGRTGSAPP